MKKLIPLFLLLASSFPLTAQERLTEGKPADVGMSAEALKQALALYEKAVADEEVHGAVLLVARRGKIVFHEAVGWRNKEKQQPMQKDTLIHLASNTKSVTAAAVLILVEEGKLGLDDPVRKYLPAFDQGRARDITVRQLLAHTSGLRIPTIFLTPLLEKSAEHPEAPSLRLEVDRFAAIGPAEIPGTTYSYNNPGYNILGALIEVVTRKPLETFYAERLYRPLGMTETYHQDRPGLVERRATIYSRKGGDWKPTYQPGDPPLYPFVRASGGMISTAQDYARFLQMFLNEGTYNGQRLLKPETVRAATTPQTRSLYTPEELERQAQLYGFGWHVDRNGVYGHGGSDGTYAWVDPRQELVVIVFTQSVGGRNPRDEFMRLVTQAIMAPATAVEEGSEFRKETHTYKTVGEVKVQADVYRLNDRKVCPVVVWIHGGALVNGSRTAVPQRLLDLCRTEGYVLVSLDYRLAPQVKLPAIIEDLRDAFRWLREQGPKQLHIDPDRLVVAGGSAGGYLTLMSGTVVKPRPRALVAYWGYGDVDGDWYSKPSAFYRQRPLVNRDEAYQGVGDRVATGAESNSAEARARSRFYLYLRQNGLWTKEVTGFDPATERARIDPYCPVRNLGPDYPPTLLIHGTTDTDVPYELSAAMAQELARQRVPHELVTVPDAGHGLDGGDPKQVAAAHAKALAFIRKHLQ